MHTFICFEGINYAGKTSVAKMVGAQMGVLYGPRISIRHVKEEAEIHKNPDHLERFAFFVEEIAARSEKVRQILVRKHVILDRYLLSVFAYHNVLVGRHLEEETDFSKIERPDLTLLLTVDESMLRNRMTMCPPRHQYESDPMFLLRVQKEFLRLADKGMSIVIDTSVLTAEETTRIVTEELGKRRLITPPSSPKE
ncbi:MAG: hypothetical protein UV08_C0017G0003 [Parcubacteria group bacterium GW2011_GWA2_42_18]|nr:MAG: hypothetical protein UV08_C0017G0003 [Parcubacteria group bacterium GW2011_GWA2_42_18]